MYKWECINILFLSCSLNAKIVLNCYLWSLSLHAESPQALGLLVSYRRGRQRLKSIHCFLRANVVSWQIFGNTSYSNLSNWNWLFTIQWLPLRWKLQFWGLLLEEEILDSSFSFKASIFFTSVWTAFTILILLFSSTTRLLRSIWISLTSPSNCAVELRVLSFPPESWAVLLWDTFR